MRITGFKGCITFSSSILRGPSTTVPYSIPRAVSTITWFPLFIESPAGSK